MTVSMITAGLLGILLLVLSGYVIAGRVRLKIDIGDGSNDLRSRFGGAGPSQFDGGRSQPR
jgi:hypothetical protein